MVFRPVLLNVSFAVSLSVVQVSAGTIHMEEALNINRGTNFEAILLVCQSFSVEHCNDSAKVNYFEEHVANN